MLMGIAMLYGSTGALNLVDVGSALARQHPTGLVVASLALITVGFLSKPARRRFISGFPCLRGGHRCRRGDLHRGHG
jgi:formate hydrogenlyase subunit 3/multisubunit Na+/H+ antiporter MnhD subunit